MDQISQRIMDLKDEIVKTRRYFHSHPETGWFTFFTTAVIADKMAKMGFDVKLGREVIDPNARQGLGSKEDCQKYLKRAKTLLNEEQAKYLDKMEDGLTGLVEKSIPKNQANL